MQIRNRAKSCGFFSKIIKIQNNKEEKVEAVRVDYGSLLAKKEVCWYEVPQLAVNKDPVRSAKE